MRAFRALLFVCLMLPHSAISQTPAADLTAEEQALCRPDAIRLCFWRIGRAEALRACLRDNRDKLSAPCLALLQSRGT